MPFHFLAALGGCQSEAQKQRALASGHYDGGKFVNPVPTRMMLPGAIWKILREQIFGSEERIPLKVIPTVKRSAKDYETDPGPGIRTTWLGHSSALVETDGVRVLTDPVWSKRVSPVQWLGPKRFFEPPLALADLPAVQAILISHDHYDHLDMGTIRELASRDLKFVTPLGVGAHLERWGVAASKVVELNWHESIELPNLKITLTPARHFSGRHLTDANHTFWGSFVLQTPTAKIFYSGDTGPLDRFAAVGERYGPFDLTLMQIGACSPHWPEIHMTPAEAVAAHLEVRGKFMIPVHWGTFNLATHAWNDPARWLEDAVRDKGVACYIPKPGEFVLTPGDHAVPQEKWWD